MLEFYKLHPLLCQVKHSVPKWETATRVLIVITVDTKIGSIILILHPAFLYFVRQIRRDTRRFVFPLLLWNLVLSKSKNKLQVMHIFSRGSPLLGGIRGKTTQRKINL